MSTVSSNLANFAFFTRAQASSTVYLREAPTSSSIFVRFLDCFGIFLLFGLSSYPYVGDSSGLPPSVPHGSCGTVVTEVSSLEPLRAPCTQRDFLNHYAAVISIPIERAVPRMVRFAASRSVQLMSCIFWAASSMTWVSR